MHYYKVTTTAVLMPDEAQHEPGLPEGDYATGYTRYRLAADRIAAMDRNQGGKPTVERVEVADK